MDCHVAPLKKKREVKRTRDALNNGDEAASASTLKSIQRTRNRLRKAAGMTEARGVGLRVGRKQKMKFGRIHRGT